ncbi:hypothetical protein [Lacticaseibacillus zeae]|nr:hypothetical protein [Lacticaseibacillus zeae]
MEVEADSLVDVLVESDFEALTDSEPELRLDSLLDVEVEALFDSS